MQPDESNEHARLAAQLAELEVKIDATYKSVEKIRWYMKMTFWGTIVVVVVPMLLMPFAIGLFMNNYIAPMQSLLGN